MRGIIEFLKTFIRWLAYGVLALIVLIGLMLYFEGEKIDRSGLNRGFVKQQLNVRAGAGTEYNIVKTLSAGDRFYVADTLDNGWLKMVLGSEDGSFSAEDESYAFVSGNYVFPVAEYDSWKQAHEAEQQRLQAQRERQRQQEADENWNRTASYTYCKNFVKDRLKAPSTAEFPSIREINIFDTGTNQYMVKGYVDAQNSFGAQIRSQFECEVQLEDETWTLLHIDII